MYCKIDNRKPFLKSVYYYFLNLRATMAIQCFIFIKTRSDTLNVLLPFFDFRVIIGKSKIPK